MPAAHALITVNWYIGDFLGAQADDENINKTQIEAHINAASQQIIDYCGRAFRTDTFTDKFDGDGERDYFVNAPPISSITSIKYRNGDTWYDIPSSYDYAYETDLTGKIYAYDFTFWSGEYNWEIIYTGGYALADIPPDLRLVCARMVQRSLLRAKDREGIASESFGNVNVTFDLGRLPADDKRVLDRYKRNYAY